MNHNLYTTLLSLAISGALLIVGAIYFIAIMALTKLANFADRRFNK
jgi:polar amino acid transport system substrate-binding protein